MGSVLGGVSRLVNPLTSQFGGAIGGGVGGIAGGVAEGAGATNKFQAGNQYDPNYLQSLIGNQNQIYGQQQSLAQALQAQMAGQGPNPAQTMFQGNVQNNIANAQGMIASQRGLNPALAVRMGTNAAASANQQAALGSALLQQQQQLGATSNYGALLGNMQQGNQGYQDIYNKGYSGAQDINYKVGAGNAQIRGQVAGSLLNAAGSAGAAAAGGGAAHGGIIGGKASVPGDSPANDTVNMNVSPGEIVIPRSMAHDPEKAKAFIDHLLKDKKKVGYGDVVAARRKRK